MTGLKPQAKRARGALCDSAVRLILWPMSATDSALDASEIARARALLTKEGTERPVRYLRAMSAARAGSAAGAQELDALAEEGTALRPYLLMESGLAWKKLGKTGAATPRRISTAERIAGVPRFSTSDVKRVPGGFKIARAKSASCSGATSSEWTPRAASLSASSFLCVSSSLPVA